MKLLYLFFFIVFLNSCSHKLELAERHPESMYQGSGVEQFFLPELPLWANFSQNGRCQKSVPIRYLDFSKLSASYSLGYFDSVQLQVSFNKSLEGNRKDSKQDILFLKDEVYLFTNAYQKITGLAYEFTLPEFQRIHAVWIDLYLADQERINRLKRLMQTNSMGEGFPVFISSCLGDTELQAFIDKNFSNSGVKKISAEFFTPYDRNLRLGNGFSFDLKEFFGEKTVILFGPEAAAPRDIIGFKQYKKL